MTFRPGVLKAQTDSEFRWSGHFLVPGLFDGEHIFTIGTLGVNRVRFTQVEIFKGILVPLFDRGLDRCIHRGFEEMNQAFIKRQRRFYKKNTHSQT